MNTAFIYLYRDAGNNKEWGRVVFAGTVSDEREQALIAALEDGEYFIARQVGIPETFFELYWDDIDHCYHEFARLEPTRDKPTDPRTIEAFIAEVEQIGPTGWQAYNRLDDMTPEQREANERKQREREPEAYEEESHA